MAPKPTKREVWMLSCTCVEGIIVLHVIDFTCQRGFVPA